MQKRLACSVIDFNERRIARYKEYEEQVQAMLWQMELQRRAEEEKVIHEAEMQEIHDYNVGRKHIRRARMREQMEEAARLYDEA